MPSGEYESVHALLSQVLEQHGVEGMLKSATLAVLNYAQLCGHGITRGKLLMVIDTGSDNDGQAAARQEMIPTQK